MLGPYIKSRGTKMSANADLITLEIYVQQGENNQFFIHGPHYEYLKDEMSKMKSLWMGGSAMMTNPYPDVGLD